ncbi:MAG: VCBS repeat-containing protein, partial [Acidobacteriota bacterium]
HPTSGEVYVAGFTASTNFPGTADGAQPASGGDYDAFVARLDPKLTVLDGATYLGGSSEDVALAILPTSVGVYVSGFTLSTNFPGTAGGAQAVSGGGTTDAFVARLNPALTVLDRATYLGGSDTDGAYALAINPTSGEVYVAGHTFSTNFPGTAGGAQAAKAAGDDVFVARLNAALTTLVQSTYLGGSGTDYANALAIHPTSGEVYVAGFTLSTNFPGTAGGAQAASGGDDVFVVRLTADLLFRAQGDFDGNGSIDILWRNVATGDNTIWRMSGNNVSALAALPTIPDQNWQIGGVGDFSGDGLSDIVWRNNVTGQNTIWVMNGAALASQTPLPPVSDVNWRIRAVADFNGDGKADLLWRNISTGENTVWFMNGSSVISVAPVPTVVDVNWEIDGAADFDGDGRPDILWRNIATGHNTMWLMNGTVVKSLAAVPPVTDLNWRIGGVGDYTGDAQPDILWRNIATGQNTVWTMSTTQVVGAIPIPSVPDVNWRIAGPR